MSREEVLFGIAFREATILWLKFQPKYFRRKERKKKGSVNFDLHAKPRYSPICKRDWAVVARFVHTGEVTGSDPVSRDQ